VRSAFVYFRWSCGLGLGLAILSHVPAVSLDGLVSSGLDLGLVTLVLVLRIWSCLHHCFVTACFVTWSCHFGLGHGLGLVSSGLDLGLITLVLVMVLRIWTCLHHCFVTT